MSGFWPPVPADDDPPPPPLPRFTNGARCERCGNRLLIRVHYDMRCARYPYAEHYHRLCDCGHEWLER